GPERGLDRERLLHAPAVSAQAHGLPPPGGTRATAATLPGWVGRSSGFSCRPAHDTTRSTSLRRGTIPLRLWGRRRSPAPLSFENRDEVQLLLSYTGPDLRQFQHPVA